MRWTKTRYSSVAMAQEYMREGLGIGGVAAWPRQREWRRRETIARRNGPIDAAKIKIRNALAVSRGGRCRRRTRVGRRRTTTRTLGVEEMASRAKSKTEKETGRHKFDSDGAIFWWNKHADFSREVLRLVCTSACTSHLVPLWRPSDHIPLAAFPTRQDWPSSSKSCSKPWIPTRTTCFASRSSTARSRSISPPSRRPPTARTPPPPLRAPALRPRPLRSARRLRRTMRALLSPRPRLRCPPPSSLRLPTLPTRAARARAHTACYTPSRRTSRRRCRSLRHCLPSTKAA